MVWFSRNRLDPPFVFLILSLPTTYHIQNLCLHVCIHTDIFPDIFSISWMDKRMNKWTEVLFLAVGVYFRIQEILEYHGVLFPFEHSGSLDTIRLSRPYGELEFQLNPSLWGHSQSSRDLLPCTYTAQHRVSLDTTFYSKLPQRSFTTVIYFSVLPSQILMVWVAQLVGWKSIWDEPF